MRGVLALALAVAAVVFSTLCIGGALAFGASLEVGAPRRGFGTRPAVAPRTLQLLVFQSMFCLRQGGRGIQRERLCVHWVRVRHVTKEKESG